MLNEGLENNLIKMDYILNTLKLTDKEIKLIRYVLDKFYFADGEDKTRQEIYRKIDELGIKVDGIAR
jgi:hypothetical protein